MQKIISIWFCKYIYRCHYTGLFSCEPPPASLSRLLLSISWEGPAQNLFLSVIAWTFFDDFFSLTDMSDEKIPAYLLNRVLADFSTRKITSSLDFDNNNWFFWLNVSLKLAWCCLEHFKSDGYSVRKQIVTDQQAGRKTNFVWNSMPVFFFKGCHISVLLPIERRFLREGRVHGQKPKTFEELKIIRDKFSSVEVEITGQ